MAAVVVHGPAASAELRGAVPVSEKASAPVAGTVTVLSEPTAAVPKLALPPERLTLSLPTTPERLRVAIVAEVFPSYTLSWAVKLPVRLLAVTAAVVVHGPAASEELPASVPVREKACAP